MTSSISSMIFKFQRFSVRSFSRSMSSTRELNEGFYQKILQFHEEDVSLTVNKLEINPACDVGESFVSSVDRVTVNGTKNGESYIKNLIVKQLPNYDQRLLYRSRLAMENEDKAYSRIIPALARHAAAPLPIVKCVYSDDDVIILEDLAEEGYSSIPRTKEGLSVEQCKLVIEGLANLHAASFVMKQKQPRAFDELTKLTKELLYHESDSILLSYQADSMEPVIEAFSNMPSNNETQKCLDFLKELKVRARTQIKELLTNPTEHSVMCHGDCWAGNIMFDPKDNLKLIDLQNMRYNSVATDLSYLLYINLTPENRVEHSDKLLDLYLGLLLKNTKQKGVDMDETLTKSWLTQEMQTFSLYGLVYGMWVMPLFFVKKDQIDPSRKKISDTAKTAKLAGTEFETRMKNMVLEYVRSLN